VKTEINRSRDDEVAVLRSQLKSAKAQIRHLRNEVLKRRVRLDPIEHELLREIAENHIDDTYVVSFAETLEHSKGRLEYHLTRLLKRGYIEIRFVDPELGENFTITQKGRHALFGPSLH
jgi:DNA-binding MarR family transcriptional regulator